MFSGAFILENARIQEFMEIIEDFGLKIGIF